MLSTFFSSAAVMIVLPLKFPLPKLFDSSSNIFANRSRACTISSAGFEDVEGNSCWPENGELVDFSDDAERTTCATGANVEECEAVGTG